MRSLALLVQLVPALALAAPPAEAPADGFDHITHEGEVRARAALAPECSRCHKANARGALSGAPGHASCFGDCHGKPPARPYRIDPDQLPVCRACHPPAQLERLARGGRQPMRPSFPPYSDDREFALTLSHAAHRSVTGGCRSCHAQPSEPDRPARRAAAAAGHAGCASCHTKGHKVPMTACAGCHTPAIGPVRAPRAEPGPFPTGRRFSHRKHLPRTRAGCATCHAGAAAATGGDIPTPKKEHCATCHDGKKAFSMVDPACRRCHAPPDREEPTPERGRRSRFSHATHAESDCRACHALDARGVPGPIGRGHQPCSDSACHAADFAARRPETCTVCHARAEPWRELHLDPQPTDRVEFGVRFSHAAHAASDDNCGRCHVPGPSGRFGQVAGHPTCSGKGCHAPAGGVTPALGDCAGCHGRGLTTLEVRPSVSRRWSVRARFSHERHRSEPTDPSRALPCTGCHTGVGSATSLRDLGTPGKPTCARCHDGLTAFKLTGHSCGRCHSGR